MILGDVSAYLVQLRCPDGALTVAVACAGARPQRASDPMLMRRHDWPAPVGYMAQDAIEGPLGPETLWSFAPSQTFNPSRGDGGEVYRIEGGTVRISLTQDGGKPWPQGFYGAACGGTGWVVFRADAPTGGWTSLTARLSDRRVPSACRATDAALTRYRLERVAAPWIIGGRAATLTLPTVISEHYDARTIGSARNMERAFFAKGVGRVVWEAWTRGAPSSGDTAVRCPGTAWSKPPAAGWVLSDCRYATNLVAADGSMSGARFGWPSAVTSPLP